MQHLNGRIFCCSLVNRRSFFSSSAIFFFPFCFSLRHSVQKMCCNCALGLELAKNKMK